MPSSGFFREPVMPSHAQDFHARERFLLDTYAERRQEARVALPERLRAMVVGLVGR